MPPEIVAEGLYRFPNVVGYDGQLYHVIAHDPLFRRGFDKYVEQTRTRYRRILVPGLAALLSFGQPGLLHAAYIFVVLWSIFLGTYWLSLWCQDMQLSSMWGAVYLLLPSTLVTLQFFVVDGTLIALIMGALWYARKECGAKLFIVLCLCALTRETGVFIPAAYCLWLLYQARVGRAVLFAAALLPALAWYLFVRAHTKPGGPEWFSIIPFLGVYRGVMGHWTYAQQYLVVLDLIGIFGMLLGFAMAVYLLRKRENRTFGGFIAAIFILFAAFLSNKDVWPEVNAIGRYYAPVLLYALTTAMAGQNWRWSLIPIGLVDLRIIIIWGHHAIALAKAILHRPS